VSIPLPGAMAIEKLSKQAFFSADWMAAFYGFNML
jgi:hypothetical protein